MRAKDHSQSSACPHTQHYHCSSLPLASHYGHLKSRSWAFSPGGPFGGLTVAIGAKSRGVGNQSMKLASGIVCQCFHSVFSS